MAKVLSNSVSASCSKSVNETVNGSHHYTIKGYSLAKGTGAGKYISSDIFTVGGYEWAIYFYPDGKNPEDNSSYVSVFVALASEGIDVRALFELTLLDQSGKGNHKVHSHFDRSLASGPYTLKYRGSMCRYWYVTAKSLHSFFIQTNDSINWRLFHYPSTVSDFYQTKGHISFLDGEIEVVNKPLVLDHHELDPKYRGYKRFFRRSALESSDYLKDDCLIMKCTVGVVRSRTEGPKYYRIPEPPSDIGRCLEKLLESGTGSDIVFRVKDETFEAHKLVLAARSPVFRAQFYGLIGDPYIDSITVEDVEPPIFKALLQFIYSDELPDIQEFGEPISKCTSTIVVQHLLAAADRYGLDRLKLLCEAKLCEEITADTVATTMALAEQHHCPLLKSACLKFVSDPGNLGAVMLSEGFLHLEETCPLLLSEILQTIAVVGEESSMGSSKKRGGNNNMEIILPGNIDLNERYLRRRV